MKIRFRIPVWLILVSVACGDSPIKPTPLPSNSFVCNTRNGLKITCSTSSPATSWDWDFGDGSDHDLTQNPTHIYAAGGSYRIRLVTDGKAVSEQTRHIFISTFGRSISIPTPRKPGESGGFCPLRLENDGTIDAEIHLSPPGDVSLYIRAHDAPWGANASSLEFRNTSKAVGNWNVRSGASWCVMITNIGQTQFVYTGNIIWSCPYDCGW